MLTWPSKDPDEVLDYKLDWTPALAVAETVSTSVFSVVTGHVAINSQSLASPISTVWLSGGTEGESCTLNCRVTTSGGRTYDQRTRLRIRTH